MRQYAGAFKKVEAENQEVQGLAINVKWKRDNDDDSNGNGRSDELGKCLGQIQSPGASSIGGSIGRDDGLGIVLKDLQNKKYKSKTMSTLFNESRKNLGGYVTGSFKEESRGIKSLSIIFTVCSMTESGDILGIEKILDEMRDNTGADRSGNSDETTNGNKFRGLLTIEKLKIMERLGLGILMTLVYEYLECMKTMN